MSSRPGVLGAVGAWTALLGGVLLAIGEAVSSGALGALGGVLLVGGVLWFFGAAVRRWQRIGSSLKSALRDSARDALRLAWFVVKGL